MSTVATGPLERFLGYQTWPKPQTLGEQIAVKRHLLGLSVSGAAKLTKGDEGTYRHWKRDVKPKLSAPKDWNHPRLSFGQRQGPGRCVWHEPPLAQKIGSWFLYGVYLTAAMHARKLRIVAAIEL